jgi:hypothetical protein
MDVTMLTVRCDDQRYRRIKRRAMATCWTVRFHMIGCALAILGGHLASMSLAAKHYLLLLPVRPANH